MLAARLFHLYPRSRFSLYSSAQKLYSTIASQKQRHSSTVTPLSPREFPSTRFEVVDPSKSVEEERLPFYNCHDYYPIRIGEVIKERYQVATKLSYGTGSTVLKVHINTLKHNQELQVYRYLASITKKHPGRDHIRRLEDSFTLKGHNKEHDVFVMKALGMSALNQVLLGLDFLHGAEVIHTNLYSDNLLITLTNDAVLTTVENQEFSTLSARKQIGDTIIYVSRYMMGGPGPLVICDFGQYRAPEVILNMKWGNAVDMWSVGLLQNDAHHLAMMTALLGPPPPEFLNESKETSKY
ncbi:kinase-like protein [Hyaloscypha finlandica]|nr:kinase-like protein [Hyaloscypha finlandica]